MHDFAQNKYEFDEFELDIPRRRLRRAGEIVALNPKAFDLLLVLVENSGRLLSKDDLFRLVWGDQIVEESNLTVNMSAIRRALGERANQPRFITTVSGQGYRFVADVREVAEVGHAAEGSGDDDEMIVESRTVARITVAEENESEPVAEALPLSASVPALPAAGVKSAASHYLIAFAGMVLLGFVIFTGYFLLGGRMGIRGSYGGSSEFKAAGMKRLTNIGNVNAAALSPDGKLFAYVAIDKDGRRTLWQGHVDGSRSVEILPAAAADVIYHGLTFAPDGGSLFYNVASKEFPRGAIFKVRVFGGVPEKIHENVTDHFTLAPDGKQFAFVRNDAARQRSVIVIYDFADGTERELASRPLESRFISTTAAWSPDGKQLAVNAINNEAENTRETFLVSLADGVVRQLTNQSWLSTRVAAWAKDGSSLYLVASLKNSVWETQLWQVSIADGSARQLVSDLIVYGGVLNVSADNKSLLVLQTQQYSNIYIAPADNLDAARQITFDLLGKRSGWSALGWTPDQRLIFSAFVDTSETIWAMNAEGKEQKQMIPEGGSSNYFGLSKDGQKLVVTSNRTGSWEVWLAGGDGSSMHALTSGGNNSQGDISPDGNWVVYSSAQSGVPVLRRMPAGGGESTPVTDGTGNWPRFSPDGKFIAYCRTINNKSDLVIINAETGGQVKSFNVPQTANFNNGIRWTPAGDAIAYRDWNNGIWRQGIEDSEPRRLPGLPEEKLYSFGWSSDGKKFAFTRGTEIRDLVLIQNSN